MNRPSFYVIIPANVRYDKALPDKAKLLYGEITALCNKEGFCWAKNEYFAELYGLTDRNIQRLIKALKDGGYIDVVIDQKSMNPRKIFLANLTTKMSHLTTKMSPAHDKNVTPSIYSINNTINTPENAFDFLFENYQSRVKQEFLMKYKKEFVSEAQYQSFLKDFNDEADMKDRAYGDWLLPMLKKYARNWLRFRRLKVVKPEDELIKRPEFKKIG